MFGKTGSVISKTISDIKNIAFISRLVFYIFGIIIPIYNILVFRGWLLLHIVSLCVSVVMLTLFLIYNDTNDKQQRKAIKAKRKSLRKIKKWVRRVNNLYILLCTVYAICVVNTEISLISLFLTVIALEEVIQNEQPNIVLVHGDTTTTFAPLSINNLIVGTVLSIRAVLVT